MDEKEIAFITGISDLRSAVGETQRALVEEALRASNGKKQEAARQLGISRYAFARLLKKVGVTSESRPK